MALLGKWTMVWCSENKRLGEISVDRSSGADSRLCFKRPGGPSSDLGRGRSFVASTWPFGFCFSARVQRFPHCRRFLKRCLGLSEATSANRFSVQGQHRDWVATNMGRFGEKQRLVLVVRKY